MPNPAIFSPKEKRIIERVIRFKDLPYNPFRTKLYSVRELMKGYPQRTLDQKIADHYKAHNKNMPDVHEALAQRIHDHAIDQGLKKFVTPSSGASKQVVGVMGGHSVLRTDPSYAAMAQIAWVLAQKRFVIVTGGGPGIMEAANLGAYLATRSAADLNQSIETLKKFPDYNAEPEGYVEAAKRSGLVSQTAGLAWRFPLGLTRMSLRDSSRVQ